MPGLTYTISDAKYAEFKLGFLKLYPVPLNKDGTPTMTENEWVKERGKQWFINSYKRGKAVLHKEAEAAPEENIVT